MKKYAISADRLRKNLAGEMIWSTHMDMAHPVTLNEFQESCDLSRLLDEDETIADFVESDPDHGFYHCDTPNGSVYFIQQSGFEFFFTADGKSPSYFRPEDHELTLLMQGSSALASTLLGANDGRLQGSNGVEESLGTLPSGIEIIHGRISRYRLMKDDQAIAGLSVRENRIENLFVHPEHRRNGLASLLLDEAEKIEGPIRHSESLTEDGRKFKSAHIRSENAGEPSI